MLPRCSRAARPARRLGPRDAAPRRPRHGRRSTGRPARSGVPSRRISVSQQPVEPQPQGRPSGLSGMCPTSPPKPNAPVMGRPSTIRPPPTPTSPEMNSRSSIPAPRPRRCSASAPRSASFATSTLTLVPSASPTSWPRGTSDQPRFGAMTTTPSVRRTIPQKATATPDQLLVAVCAVLEVPKGSRNSCEIGDRLVRR